MFSASFLSVGVKIFCDNSNFSSTDAFKGLIMIPKSKKVFSNHQTWHVAHVAQLAAAAGSPHSRHTQPWTSFTRSETERSANTRLPAQIKTNTKLSCQNFRFNDLPVATAGDAGGEKLGRAAPGQPWPAVSGVWCQQTHHLWPEDASENFTGLWHHQA